MTQVHARPSTAGGLMVLTTLLAGPALGDVITADWNHNTSFSYEITHMPDLDQRRQEGAGVFGLPGNGSMYCVPTSTMNMFIYAANHGFPNVLPGPGNWQSNSLYNAATINIFLLGEMMETDAREGTGGFEWRDGAIDWLNQNSEGAKFTVQLKYFSSALGPNLNSLAKSAINGHLVSLGYGRYSYIGTYEGLPRYVRSGGHIVTMSKAHRSGSDQKLWVRDPADSMSMTSQSTFVNTLWEVENKAVYILHEGENYLRLFSALGYEAPPETARFIDGALYIRPKAGYAFTDTGGILSITQYIPWPLIGSPQPASEFAVNVPGTFIDGLMASNGADVYTINQIAGVPNRITCTDLLTDESIGLGEFPGAFQLALSPSGLLYILTPNLLHCMNLMEEEHPLQSVELPAEGSAIAFDLKNNEVAVLTKEHVLLAFSDLSMPPCVIPIPNDIPMEGAAVMSVDPSTGMYWFATEANNMLFGLMMDDAGAPVIDQILAPDLGMPTSFDFDDAGHVYITDGTSLVEMMKTATAGWQPVADSAFAGPGGKVFQMTKSESNFDPELHTGPGYFNIDPDELEFGEIVFDCYEDLNDDGLVSVADLLLLLAAWGECGNGPCAADLTGDRTVGVPDLLELLAAWGDCP